MLTKKIGNMIMLICLGRIQSWSIADVICMHISAVFQEPFHGCDCGAVRNIEPLMSNYSFDYASVFISQFFPSLVVEFLKGCESLLFLRCEPICLVFPTGETRQNFPFFVLQDQI